MFIRLFKRLILILFIYMSVIIMVVNNRKLFGMQACKLYGNEHRHHLIVCFKF